MTVFSEVITQCSIFAQLGSNCLLSTCTNVENALNNAIRYIEDNFEDMSVLRKHIEDVRLCMNDLYNARINNSELVSASDKYGVAIGLLFKEINRVRTTFNVY